MRHDTSGWIAISISISAVLNLALLLFSAYWKLPIAEQRLVNCRIVSNTKSVWRGNDPIARFNRLGAVALVFTLSGLLDKRGLIDRNEADHVPLSLRMWTTGPVLGSCLILVVAVSFWVIDKITIA